MTRRRIEGSVVVARYAWLPWRLRYRAGALELRRRSEISLEMRVALLRYGRAIQARLPDTDDLRAAGPIWFYWAQGPEAAPPVVGVCLERLRRFAGSRSVVVLDDGNVSQFITLPDEVTARRPAMGATHFSDVLRTALLAEHGGTWVDATVYLTAPIPAEIARLPFFAFSRPSDPYVLSSWFIHARPGHSTMLGQRDMLYAYWREQDSLVDYFLFHLLFECGITMNRSLRAAWASVPDVDYAPSQRLQEQLPQPFDEQLFRAICERTGIHKLTWKLGTRAAIGPPTFRDVLIPDTI